MYVKVRVVAGKKVETFNQTSVDHFTIWVKQKAERNMANHRVVELIAQHFKVGVAKVRIISGHHSPSKILSVDY